MFFKNQGHNAFW